MWSIVFIAAALGAGLAMAEDAPPGMVAYDHPVYKNGKRVLWHGVSHGDKSAAEPKASDSADNADASADHPKAKDKPAARRKAKDAASPKPPPSAAAAEPAAQPEPKTGDYVISADSDDACASRVAADLAAAAKAAGFSARAVSGHASPRALAKLADSESVDLAIAPLDALADDSGAWKAKAPYVTRLGNETVEIVALKSIDKISSLEGHAVAVGPTDSGAETIGKALLARLNIKPRLTSESLSDGLDDLVFGRVEAVVAVGAGHAQALADFNKSGKYHLVAVPMTAALVGHYAPVKLTSAERPRLAPAGESVDTVSAPMALIAANAPAGSARATREGALATALFDRFASLAAGAADPSLRDVNLAAKLDWPRLAASEGWVAAHVGRADPAFDAFRSLARNAGEATPDADKLFQSLLQARAGNP